MKKIIPIFALAAGCVLAEPRAIDLFINGQPTKSTAINGVKIYAPNTAALVHYFVVVTSHDKKDILRFSPLPTLKWANRPEHSFVMTQNEYVRPDTPQEVKADLWTSDGKHWVAKWGEAK